MSITDFFGLRRIIIYGTGNTGNDFYQKYKDKLDIKGCTSSDKEVIPIDGLIAINNEEINKEKDVLIVCSVYYEEIRRDLAILGWKQNVDFICWDIFDKLFEKENNNKQLGSLSRFSTN